MADRIILIRSGGLGDVLLAFPTVAALHSAGGEVHVVGPSQVWSLAGPMVRSVTSIEAPHMSGLYGTGLEPSLLHYLQGASRIVLWSTRPPSPTLCARFPIEQYSPFPPPGRHAAAWYARTAGVEMDSFSLSLGVEDTDRAESVLTQHGLHRPILLHPGAGSAWKRWPASAFARLVTALQGHTRDLALIEGPADAATLAAVEAHLSTPVPVLRSLSLRTLAAVLARASRYIGNDSGVTHLASLTGAPVLALFGPTDPANWAPLSGTVLRACGSTALYAGQIRVCADADCMAAITLEEVEAAVDNLC